MLYGKPHFLLSAFVFCCCTVFAVLRPDPSTAAHGLSLSGNLLYEKDFTHFAYTSSDALKGGELVLHAVGSFDKMNPYTLKGTAPLGLEELVYEPLAVSSLDEPFAKYGLITENITVAEDQLSMVLTLDEKAMFSDGTKVTAEDVLFSLQTMKGDRVHPLYADYFHDIEGGEVLGRNIVKFNFKRKNRELPLIALSIPIFSKQFYDRYDFGENDTLVPPLGTGPYMIDKVLQGKTIVYKRNPAYWAKTKNVRKNMFNFDTITVKYYKDQTVAVEAFKAGEFDVQYVNIAKQWARDMTGPKFDDGSIVKESFPHQNNAGMQGFVFNLRKKIFADPRVREAISLAFDFEWTNSSLFYDQYTRSDSFFSNSYLAARGKPQGLELDYLLEFKDVLPDRVFTTPLEPPVNNSQREFRKHLRQAQDLLREAGWTVTNDRLTNAEGKIFTFEIMLVSSSFSRVMAPFVHNLNKLGIEVDYRVVDPALYTERVQSFDFDMIVHVFGQSQSPGNEQKNYWHSEAADIRGSGNIAGIKSPVVDALVEKIIYATTQEELTAATMALDRVLWYGFYVIPNWHVGVHRLAYYNTFKHPDVFPKYYNYFQLLMTWWYKE
ncbi:MAG: extracellular solute-binding protein [Desulfopila sp.]|nr:extracellular solute-binding protein [Desulfopila sp.]